MTAANPQLQQYARMINDLHGTWKPHPGQVKVGQALFKENKRMLFISAGRKWGKTEEIMYFLWRWAMTYPKLGNFYICPELKHARKLVWTDPRVKDFGPKSWIKDINETEMRIRLINDAYIQIDGSDNYEAHRGSRPGLVVYEESKDHKRRFREIMRPNMQVYNAPEIHIGTPPSDDDKDETIGYWDELEQEFKSDPDAFYYNGTCWENPHNDRAWLLKEKARLYARGEGHVWEREYEAKRVKGGVKRIFPMLPNEDKAFVPHDELMARLRRDRKKLEWYWWADPAGASCFAVLFAAINPYTKTVYWLDEIYETDQARMTVKTIGAEIISKRNELYELEDAWRQGYDEAETWFSNEWQDNFTEEEGLEPSHKAQNDKESGLSLLKDIMLAGKSVMSDRCKKFFWELNKYKTLDNGKLPKKDDHLIDDARYILAAAGYENNEVREQKESQDEDFRGARISDDFPGIDEFTGRNDDWEDYE